MEDRYLYQARYPDLGCMDRASPEDSPEPLDSPAFIPIILHGEGIHRRWDEEQEL